METLWFCLVAIMIAGYVVLDGFDLGAGILHAFVARDDDDKRTILRSIGPVWDGNEVWLLAGGGTLYFAFPELYASSFSGFYLPLMMVLWLLMLRGISIEFRNHIQGPGWSPFWDFFFFLSSALLAIFFGAALGNVVRGVPLNERNEFFLPLWTNFQTGREVGILDWFTVLIGLLAFATLTLHGALWLNLKTENGLQERSRKVGAIAYVAVILLTALATIATFTIQPRVPAAFQANPAGAIFPALAVLGLGGIAVFGRQAAKEVLAFLSSCLFIVGMLTSAAFGLYPYVLPSNLDAKSGLTVFNCAAPAYGLSVGLWWFVPGMLLALGYTFYVYRQFAGKVRLEEGGH